MDGSELGVFLSLNLVKVVLSLLLKSRNFNRECGISFIVAVGMSSGGNHSHSHREFCKHDSTFSQVNWSKHSDHASRFKPFGPNN